MNFFLINLVLQEIMLYIATVEVPSFKQELNPSFIS